MNYLTWAITVLAFVGTAVCLYTTLDAQADLNAQIVDPDAPADRRVRQAMAGRIARRSAASSGIMHLSWLLIGLLVVLPQLKWLANLLGPIGLTVAIIVMQVVAVVAQLRNQIDRVRLRRS